MKPVRMVSGGETKPHAWTIKAEKLKKMRKTNYKHC